MPADLPRRSGPLLVGGRWLGQLATLLLALSGELDRSAALLLALVALSALGNPLLLRLARGVEARAVAVALVLDLALMAAVLARTGGAANPFTLALLWWVLLGAVALPGAHAAAVTLASVLAYGVVYLQSSPVHDHAAMLRHLLGMWIAFAIVAPILAGAVHLARRNAEQAHHEREEARAAEERATRSAALATLAAGAAHELATPLSTIAVVVAELQRAGRADPELDTVRGEIERCRRILRQLAADVGAGMGEAVVRAPLAEIVDLALEQVPDAWRVEVDEAELDTRVEGLPRLLATALANVLRNAIQASPEEAPVSLRVRPGPGFVELRVEDRGAGMDPATVGRAGEPFFTTRKGGLGLGLFVARSAVEQSGGEFRIESGAGRGTSVIFKLKAVS